MRFRMPWWVRRYLRSRMDPMTEAEVWRIKEKISFVYTFLAANALMVVLYVTYKEDRRSPEWKDVRPALYYGHLMGVDKANVVRISGLHVKHDVIDTRKQPLPPRKPFVGDPNALPYDEILADEIFCPTIYA